MPIQSSFTLESLKTNSARVRAAITVRLLVHLQVGAVEERLRALSAFVRAFFEVRSLVVN